MTDLAGLRTLDAQPNGGNMDIRTHDCEKCRKMREMAYLLAIRHPSEAVAFAITERLRDGEILCDDHAAEYLGADNIGRRNADDGTPWTHGFRS